MIIGNNNKITKHDNFVKNFQTPTTNTNPNPVRIDPFRKVEESHYIDPTNKNEIADKSFNILKQRLDQGLITLDEFNKKCNQINKLRQK